MRNTARSRSSLFTALSLIAVSPWLLAGTAKAAGPDTIALFNPAAFETPESIQFDHKGNMIISLALTGEVRRISPKGVQTTLAWLPLESQIVPCGNAFGIGIMGGLALSPDDEDIYVSVNSCDTSKIGVYRISECGQVSLVAALGPATVPNGIAWHDGLLYVADTNLGRVLRVNPRKSTFEVWSADPMLTPLPDFFPGPNGLQIFHDEVYVSVSDHYYVLAFPIRRDGTAGKPRVHATGVGFDDFAFDVHGNLYGTTDPFNTLVKVAPDGTSTVLLTAADLLDGPTSAAFGVRPGDRENLYFCNGAFPFFSLTHRPSIMRLDVGERGAPR